MAVRRPGQTLRVDSVTKASVPVEVAAAIVADTWRDRLQLVTATPLNGGFFNASLRLDLSDGTSCVLRVAPPPEVPVLRYEHGLIFAEAEALQLVAALTDIPVARVIRLDPSCTVIGSPYLLVSRIEGRPLVDAAGSLTAPQVQEVERQLGAVLAQLHGITGPAFGYLAPGTPRHRSWPEAFLGMLDGVLADGEALDLPLPWPYARIRAAARAAAGSLAAVTVPRLVHWDLWPGNVFVHPDRRPVLAGVIDFERSLWGDPLLEHQFRRHVNPDRTPPPGYTRPLEADDGVATRCLLYDVYLYAIMTIECAYRQFPTDDQHRWALDQLTVTLPLLEAAGS